MAEAKRNSFKQLEEEQINEFLDERPNVTPQIELGVMGNVRTVGFFGDILELYLPRVFELFVCLFGGGKKEEKQSDEEVDFTSGNQKPD